MIKRNLFRYVFFLFYALLPGVAQLQTPPCDPLASGSVYCSNACVFCDLTTLQGTVGTTPNLTGSQAICGQILLQSPLFYAFVAGLPSIEFVVEPGNCWNGDGIQVVVLDDCSNPTILYCDPGGTGLGNTPTFVQLDNLIPGKVYYIMIDTWAGDICDITIHVITPAGFTAPPIGAIDPIQGPSVACSGLTEQYCINAVPGAGYYTWSAPPGALINGSIGPLTLAAPGGNCVNITMGNHAGTINVAVSNNCVPPKEAPPFPVSLQVAPKTQLPSLHVPFENVPYHWPLNPAIVAYWPGAYSFSVVIPTSFGCDSIVQQNIIVDPPLPGTVTGILYHDYDNDGIRDIGEPNYPGPVMLQSSSGQFATVDSLGHYILVGLQTGDTIRVVPPSGNDAVNPDYYIYQPGIWNNYDFGIYVWSGLADLDINISTPVNFRPGFTSQVVLTVDNLGVPTASGVKVSAVLPAGVTYVNASPSPVAVYGDSIVWSFPSISATDIKTIIIGVKTNISTGIGTLLFFQASVTSNGADQNLSNNEDEVVRTVVASVDPNDKQVEPTKITPAFLISGKPLEYTIRFQNTGTAPAEFVRIVDTLGATIDPASFRLIASSHPCTWKMSGKGILEFLFDQINLPDSTENEPASHGFVHFSVRPASGLQPGWEIQNNCDIYFDYNAPIRTNTAGTKVEYQTPGNALLLDHGLRFKPNPAAFQTQCYWSTPAPADGFLRVYSLYGKLEMEVPVSTGESQKTLLLTTLPSGLYIVSLQAGNLFLVKELAAVQVGSLQN